MSTYHLVNHKFTYINMQVCPPIILSNTNPCYVNLCVCPPIIYSITNLCMYISMHVCPPIIFSNTNLCYVNLCLCVCVHQSSSCLETRKEKSSCLLQKYAEIGKFSYVQIVLKSSLLDVVKEYLLKNPTFSNIIPRTKHVLNTF